ncbi:TRAP transporter large permease subunit [Cupriavidus sp. CV2]|uniref:TRAP transporter large permease n=1 Tax=Cupriavidus ulmosensis TaxID=3065913 RepID=UPI00296B4C28|nr:TRAP transporter large permease subunit [Cupriavidus sp. CV2]MDW3681768.1 TRAP transporter large permease subunit [Cupriavidus sp. CV2]
MIPLEYMPPLMFGGLVVFMLIGFPVAFSLSAVGLAFGILAIQFGYFPVSFLQAVPSRVFGSVLANELLLAIPFFTFMGAILEKCGLAEDMLDSMGQLFGPVRGGLGYSVIIVGFILGAITGTVAAQVIAMAMISLPVMMRYRYNMKYATGVLAASGTITQLVPPSLVLVVLADQLKTPMGSADVGSMYLGAWGPSVIQIALFALYTFVLARVKPDWLPPVPVEERTLRGWPLWRKCLRGIIPCAVLIFLVLGTIMLGIATPTESGAMGAVGALVLAVLRDPGFGKLDRTVYRIGLAATGVAIIAGTVAFGSHAFRIPLAVVYLVITWLLLRAGQLTELRGLIIEAYQSTARITAMVVFILIGSTCFSVVFQGVDGGAWVEHMFTSLPGGWIGFLLVVNLFIFFLAFFLDFFEIAFIVVPMLAPVAVKVLAPVVADSMGGNPEAAATAALVWFGVMLCVNMQTSFMHPPFGFALFYLRGIAPKEVKSSDIYWGALPWVGLQLIMVALVMFWPGMVTMFLDKGSLHHTNAAEVTIPLGGESPGGAASVPAPGGRSGGGTLELPSAPAESEPATPQFEFDKKK